ncbi:MAG TPA: DUF1611 domain-containing protein [Pseudonocardiaceae bacterium]|nr:DUF1611 domain-containing protein [Pseudonocardiaceae bacterium]
MRELSMAKWGYLTRRVSNLAEASLGPMVREPRLGDLVVSTVTAVGVHDHLENPVGRRVRLYSGDLVVGAYGNRYATDFFEGYLPSRAEVHLLTAGGLIGKVASAHTSRGAPTELEVVGALVDQAGAPLSLDDFARVRSSPAEPDIGTVMVVGSSMNAGKTTTASSIIRGFTRAGLRVGAAKVTGSGSGKDNWSYLDAGAYCVVDFIDFGMPSTFGYPISRLITAMYDMRNALVADGAQVVVMEIADGVLQDETRMLVEQLPGFADQVVLAVSDALAAVAGIELLGRLDVEVRVISGLVTASPLGSRETQAATGLPVRSPGELAERAVFDLLGHCSAAASGVASFDGELACLPGSAVV